MLAQVITTAAFTSSDGFIIGGDLTGDNFGWSVSNAGDVNDDGIADFIVGARSATPVSSSSGTAAGTAYVIFGKAGATRTNIDVSSLAADDGFAITGATMANRLANSVSNAGDINGDGIDDLIVGQYIDIVGGAAYVIFGKAGATRANINVASLSSADGFTITGDVIGDNFGGSVSNAGDVNGDGIDDLIVGARRGGDGGTSAGEAYVIFGKSGATRANIDVATLASADGFIIQGDAANDQAGSSVSAAGDVNGDGVDDLIVGAIYGDDGGSNAGEAYVIFGRTTGFGVDVGGRQVLDLTGLSASDGFIVQGDLDSDFAGWSVANAGDINGDGVDDMVVGALGADGGGSFSGAVYVIFGKAGATRTNLDLASLAAADGFSITGDAAQDRAGISVSHAGDINGDGVDDLLIGAPGGNGAAGKAYVIFGRTGATRASIDLTTLSLTDGLVIAGQSGDRVGRSVSAAGDVNSDGFDDLLVGAPYGDVGGANTGDTYVIYGKASFGVAPITGTTGNDTLTGTAGVDVINGGEGNDVVDGGTGADALNGGTGNDIYVIDNAGDVATEASGEGTDSVETTLAAYTLTANVENLEYTGAGGFTGTGNALANIIVGGAMGDTLDGGDGDDTLGGEAGNDTLNGGNGADRLNGGTGADTMNGGDGNDILVVDNVGDVANGGAGTDTVEITANITYSIAADVETISVSSTGGTFTLNALANTYGGSSGNEIVFAGGGADTVYLRGGGDGVFGGAGNDRLFGEAGIDNLLGEDGNDLLYGGTEGDSLIGGGGNDTLYGEAGNDQLNGGAGIDILNGGAGADQYIFDAGESGSTLTTADRIQGFSSAQGDIIDLGATGLTSFIGGTAFGNVAGQVRSEVISGNTYVMGDVDGNGVADFIVRIDGVVMLGSGDFEFIAS